MEFDREQEKASSGDSGIRNENEFGPEHSIKLGEGCDKLDSWKYESIRDFERILKGSMPTSKSISKDESKLLREHRKLNI